MDIVLRPTEPVLRLKQFQVLQQGKMRKKNSPFDFPYLKLMKWKDEVVID